MFDLLIVSLGDSNRLINNRHTKQQIMEGIIIPSVMLMIVYGKHRTIIFYTFYILLYLL